MSSDPSTPSRLKIPQLLILGMHRSGTSAMAGLLDRMGAFFGPEDQKMPERDCNERGFHERLDVVTINDRILASTGSDWLKPHRFVADRMNSFRRQALAGMIQTTVNELDHHQPWYLKDPRFCLTLDLWRSALTSPFAVVTIRNPLEIARSLKKRGDCDLPVGLALWEVYTKHLIAQLGDIPFITVSYAALLEQPEQVASSIQQALGRYGFAPLPGTDHTSSWIDPSLRHQAVDAREFEDYATPAQRRLYLALIDGSALTARNLEPVSTSSLEVLQGFDQTMRTCQAEVYRLCQDRDEALRQLDGLLPRFDQLIELTMKNQTNGEQALREVEAIIHSWRWKAASRVAGILTPKQADSPRRPQPDQALEELTQVLVMNHHLTQRINELSGMAQQVIPHAPRVDPALAFPRVCAILLVHDESRFVGPCLDHMIAYGLDVYILGDRCPPEIVEEIEQRRGRGVVGLEHRDNTEIFEYLNIVRRVEEISSNPAYDWYLRCDVDEFRYPEHPGETFAEFVGRVDAEGYNAVNFNEFVFIPTREQPDHDHPRFRETMTRYYPFLPQPQFRRQLWKRQARKVDLCTYAGHRVEFPGLRVYPHCPPLHHYIYLSHHHFRRKYDDRIYPDEEIKQGLHGWRNTPTAVDIQLPSENELRLCDPADPWALDFTEPRTQPYLKRTESDASPSSFQD